MSQTSSTEVANRSLLSDEVMHDIRNAEDAFNALAAAGVEIEDMSDYGNGFTVLPTNDKARLCGVPFVILEWRFNDGDNGEFVSAAVVTNNNEKLILNDGSTGICAQLRKITDRRVSQGHRTPYAGLKVSHGLTRSDYETEIDGKVTKATTYYLAN